MDYRHPVDAAPLLVVAFGGKIFGMHRRTGQRVWSHALSWTNTIRLFVDPLRVYALGSSLIGLDALTGRLLWTAEQPGGDTLLAHGDQLFVGGAGEVRCFSAIDGTLLWVDEFRGMGLGDVSLAVLGASAQADRTG